MQDFVPESSLAESSYNLFFNLICIVDECEITKALESTLLYQLLTGTMPDTESMNSLLQVALLCYQSNHFLGIPDSTVCQKVNMWRSAVIWPFFTKDLCKWLVNACASKVCSKIWNLGDCILQILIRVIYTSPFEQELVARPITAHIEFTACRETLKEEHEGFTGKRYCVVHRKTAVNQKYVLFTTCIFVLIIHFLHF